MKSGRQQIYKVNIKKLDIIMKTVSEIFRNSNNNLNIVFRKNIDDIDANVISFFNADKFVVVKMDDFNFEQRFINKAKKYYYRISPKDLSIIGEIGNSAMFMDNNDDILLYIGSEGIDTIVMLSKIREEIIR